MAWVCLQKAEGFGQSGLTDVVGRMVRKKCLNFRGVGGSMREVLGNTIKRLCRHEGRQLRGVIRTL